MLKSILWRIGLSYFILVVCIALVSAYLLDFARGCYLGRPELQMDESLGSAVGVAALAILFAAALPILLAFRNVTASTRSISELTKMAREIAAGRMDQRIPVRSQDEIGELVEAFNHMSQRLKENTETVRREFIANVSHELRTPLASIKALVETLRDGVIEDRTAAQDFLRRMETEVDGLTQLVGELLELSRIESGQVALRPEPTDVQVLVGTARYNVSSSPNQSRPE